LDLFALATVPARPDEARRTATYKLLRATGQPHLDDLERLELVLAEAIVLADDAEPRS